MKKVEYCAILYLASKLLANTSNKENRKMASKSITAQFEALPKLVKVILLIVFGWVIGGVYRIIRYTETKNLFTLIAGLLALFTGVGNFVAEVADIVTEILSNKITLFAD